MNIWEQRYNEQTKVAADMIAERDALGALLERASPYITPDLALRQEIEMALKAYRVSKQVREDTR